MKNPNVVFDISVLGTGFYLNRARTGIFRVVENLASQLVYSSEINLSLTAAESLIHKIQCYKYLQSNPDFVAARDPVLETNRFEDWLCPYYPNPGVRTILSRLKGKSIAILSRLYPGINSILPEKVDIFHSPFHPLPRQVIKNRSIKKFITVYDLIPVLFPQYFEFKETSFIERLLKSCQDDCWITTISESTKADICNYHQIDESRIIVAYPAASEIFHKSNSVSQLEEIKLKYQIPAQPYILSLSTLEPRKNVEHVIRSFAKLIQENQLNDLCLVLVGARGWNYQQIFETISNFDNVKNRIIVTGYVDDKDLAAIYSNALMFVYPSLYEGFGLPPLEAMQCGIPVITSNTSSLPEVVGTAGLMVDPTDEDQLCQQMLNVYSDSNLHKTLSEKSLLQAKKFSWKECQEKTVTGYLKAMAE
jgi:glycosyltransferase involved in cell wall biosynthesis